MKIADLHSKKIAILWFWKEWQCTLKFLLKQGIENITVLDKNKVDISAFEKGSTAKQGGIDSITWETYLDTLSDFDIIIKSPWVSPFGEQLIPYREKFISQTQIFFSNYSGKVIGITGTKGKSTCSTLLYRLLVDLWYKAKLVGNIGSPVLEEIDLNDSYDYIVYELSSYMLQDFCPHLTVWYLNNIYPCHLDWHYDSLSVYKEAKINILRNAEAKIINWDFSTESAIVHLKENKHFFDTKWSCSYKNDTFLYDWNLLFSWTIALKGEHNKKNICWVITVLSQLWISHENISQSLYRVLPVFKWLPHRIEDIGSYEWIRFINDAIATTPQSTIAAINTFDGELQTLFLWGQDSGFDFKEIRKRILESSVQNIVAFPDTSCQVFPEIEMRDYEKSFEIEIEGKLICFIKTRDMKAWVDFAFKTTLPGKLALLSCAAPSFSLWKGYIYKAEEFVSAVREY